MNLQKDTAPYTKNIYKIFKHISYADKLLNLGYS